MIRLLLLICISLVSFGLFGCSSSDNDKKAADQKTTEKTAGADNSDDTYVPEFTSGALSFKDVWVPDVAQSGFDMDIWFTVEAAAAVKKTYVRLDLFKLASGNASDLSLDASTFQPDVSLAALVIDELANGEKRKVEQTIRVPDGVPDGTYAVVYTIKQIRSFSETENDYQGELLEEETDNLITAPASIIIGNPTKPNLRILNTKLLNSSFTPGAEMATYPTDDGSSDATKTYAFSVDVEVEAMAEHALKPVGLQFSLSIGDLPETILPIEVSTDTSEKLASRHVYDVSCEQLAKAVDPAKVLPNESGVDTYLYPSESEAAELQSKAEEEETIDPGTEKVCASLFRQSQTGKTYLLHIPQDFAESIIALGKETKGTLKIVLDPDHAVDEWEGNVSDNAKELSVVYLPDESDDGLGAKFIVAAPSNGPYPTKVFSALWDNASGSSSSVRFSMNAGPDISYYESKGIPFAFYAGVGFAGKLSLLNTTTTIWDIGVKSDLNADNITGSFFDYGVTLVGQKIWGKTYGFAEEGEDDEMQHLVETVVFSTKDSKGSEKYIKSKTFVEKKQTFVVGPVPISVKFGLDGEIGVKGQVSVEADNLLQLSIGPTAGLELDIEGGVDLAVSAAGVYGKLNVITMSLPLTAGMQVQPSSIASGHSPTFSTGLAGKITSLDGEMGMFAKVLRIKFKPFKVKKWWDDFREPFVSWDGFSKTYNLFGPYAKTWK